MSMTADAIYGPIGGPSVARPAATQTAAPPAVEAGDRQDPHDKADRGPAHWLDDPLIWLVLIAGLATGALGVRFKWWSSGVDVGARVNLGDELTTLLGTTLYAITGIVIFKVIASKVEVPGLQKLAAAI